MTNISDLDVTFAALSDPTRRAILSRLREGEERLSDLAAPFDMSQTGVSKHVAVLRAAGLVAVEKRGRVRHCRLVADNMRAASAWLADYEALWDAGLRNLGGHVRKKRQ